MEKETFKGYKVFYNTETQKYEFETEATPVGYEHGVSWSNLPHNAEKTAHKYNNELESGRRVVFLCSDCGTIVEMDEREIEWYKDRGFDLPKRCFNCRQQRKDRKNKSQESY